MMVSEEERSACAFPVLFGRLPVSGDRPATALRDEIVLCELSALDTAYQDVHGKSFQISVYMIGRTQWG